MLLNWILATIAIIITTYVVPGASIAGLFPALVTALVLGLVNAVLKPILIVLTLPITIFTLGLFTFVINALLILLTSKIVPGFHIAGFGTALIFSIVLTLVNLAINHFKHST